MVRRCKATSTDPGRIRITIAGDKLRRADLAKREVDQESIRSEKTPPQKNLKEISSDQDDPKLWPEGLVEENT